MSTLLKSPQKVIAELFGYKKLEKTSKNITNIDTNDIFSCKCCGRVQDTGYLDPQNILLSPKANNLYSFKNISSYFYCGYCCFIQKNYYKPQKISIADIVVFSDRYEKKDFKTDSIKNDLYDIFSSPPEPPFIIMLKEHIVATSIVNMSHCVLPTIDRDLLIVNYGTNQYKVPRQLALRCLNDFVKMKNIFNNNKHRLSDEVLFNRIKSHKYDYWFSPKLKENSEFIKEYRLFLNKYNYSVRFVAKIMLATYRHMNKELNVNFQ